MESPSVASILMRPEFSFPVLHIQGYLEEKAGEKLKESVQQFLNQGKVALVIDFAGCTVVNSLGMAALIDILEIVSEDYKGRVVLSALKPIMKEAFQLAEIIPDTPVAETLSEAFAILQG